MKIQAGRYLLYQVRAVEKREGDFLNNKLGGTQGPGVRRQDLTGTPRPEGRRDYSVVPNGGL